MQQVKILMVSRYAGTPVSRTDSVDYCSCEC